MYKKGKIHFAYIEKATESDNNEYISDSFCKINRDIEFNYTDNKNYVTCKKCLKIINNLRNF